MYLNTTMIQPCYDEICIHPHWQNFTPMSHYDHVIIGIVLSATGIVSFIGNAVVIFLFKRFRSLRNSANLLVLNLAIADGVLAIGNFPSLAISSFKGHWMFGKVGCDIYGFVGALTGFVSINTLTVIAMERCIVIAFKKPCQFNKTSSKTVTLIIVLIWIYSVSWSLTPVFGWGTYILEGSLTSCTFDFFSRDIYTRSYVISIFVFCFFLQVCVTGASYLIICMKVIGHERTSIFRKCNEADANVFLRIAKAKKTEKMQIKTAKVCLIIFFMFSISWTPYAVIAIIGEFGDASLITPFSSVIPGICAKVSTAMNPVVYALLHPKFRSKLRYDLKRRRNSFSSRCTQRLHSSPKTSFQDLPSDDVRVNGGNYSFQSYNMESRDSQL